MPDLDNLSVERPEDNDPLGGIDPMAWLESLAVRQGATEGFTTDHNVEVAEIDPNSVVIDEPGYTPSEVIRSRHQPPAVPPEPPAYQESPPAAPSMEFGLPDGVDPLAWLEALAARQGATEGFTTEHSGIEVAEIDPNSVVIDEPGYTPSEVIRSRHQPPAAPPEPPSLPEQPAYESPAPVSSSMDFSGGLPDGVDPLAWLEALAARQGATEGFTTEHSGIEIAEIDPNSVVIDEPGYTPSEVIRSRHQPPAEKPTAPPAPPSLPEEPAVDPLAWLEDLSNPQEDMPQQEDVSQYQQYDPSQYQQDDASQYQQYDPSQYQQDDASQYQQYDPSQYQQYDASQYQQYDPSQYQPEDASQYQQYDPSQYQQDDASQYQQYDPSQYQQYEEQPAIAPSSDFSLPDGVDPLAWLEALAARQGATEGFTTEHSGIEIAEIDPNSVVIDEPGYTPSETIRSRHQPPAAPQPPSLPEQPVFDATAYGSSELPATDVEADWLNEAESSADMSWLDAMANDANADIANFLDDIMTDEAALPGFDIDSMEAMTAAPAGELEAIPPTHTPEEVLDSIEGLSDEEIAQRQIAGTLTPVQELAWLQRQAMQLVGAREAGESETDFLAEADDLEPALSSELPPWLQNATVVDDEPESLAFIEEIITPPAPEDVPDWLETPQEFEVSSFITEERIESGETMIQLDEYDPSGDEWAEALDEEHDLLVSGRLDERTQWIEEAIKQAEDADSFEPQLETADFVLEPVQEIPVQEPSDPVPDWLSTLVGETEPAESDIPDDLPDWLKPMAQSGADDDEYDIAKWTMDAHSLRPTDTGMLPPLIEEIPTPVVDQRPVAAASLPSTENERLAQARVGSLPAWAAQPVAPAQPIAPQRPPTPQLQPQPVVQPPAAVVRPVPPKPAPPIVPPPPPVQPQVRQRVAVAPQPIPPAHPPASVPELAEFAAYRAALDTNPDDHSARLNLARALNQTGDVNASLNQYQTLVENLGEVENVKTDLVTIAQQHPVARRLLGDVYMREGYLQEALDAYRGALNNL